MLMSVKVGEVGIVLIDIVDLQAPEAKHQLAKWTNMLTIPAKDFFRNHCL
jgi:hypothetical protein